MSNTVLKENVRKRWQKGVALLFALGILGLLLVMALGFATNSIFDQLIASNSSNNASARTIAQSGLERIRNMLQNYEAKMRDIAPPYNFMTSGIFGYSHSEDTSVFDANAVNPNNDYAKSDKLQGFFSSYLFPPPALGWSSDMTNNINWIYLQADGKLTGRLAYIILNRSDLDPAKLVSPTVDEANASGANPAPLEVRLGVDANEINLWTINPDPLVETPAITHAVANNFNSTVLGGKLSGGSWLDLPFLFNLFTFNPLVPADAALEAKFTRWFICNSQNSPEAYWIDKNGDGKITSDEQFHRFNLARTDWGTFTVNDMYEKILLEGPAHGGTPVFDPAAAPASTLMHYTPITSDGYGIPWLAFFGYKSDGTAYTGADLTEMQGTFPSVSARRRQIAANLVDYCQPLTTSATSDSADWLTVAPTFTGNKKTPYINEFGGEVKLHTEITSNVGGGGVNDIKVNLQFWLYSELINIYAVDWTGPLRLNVTGIFTYRYDIGSTTGTGTTTVPINVDLDASTFNWRNGYGTLKSTVNNITINESACPPGLEHVTIDTVTFTITRAVLYVAGTPNIFYDYANINQTSTLPVKLEDNYTTITVSPGGDDQTCWFSIETEDPRQNLNSGDWTANPSPGINNLNSFAVWSAVEIPPGSGTIYGARNNNSIPNVQPAATADTEAVPDPAYISAAAHLSTAYIRQAPMVSPWELGFIHRGAKWQTINLHEYDKNKAVKYVAGAPNIIPGGGKYSDTTNGGGDANILDQIKMNSSFQNYKIDLNNEFQDPDPVLSNRYVVFYSLFKNIKSGSTLVDVDGTNPSGIVAGSGAYLSDTPDISNIINNIINRSGTGVSTYLTRAQVVNDIVAGASPIPGYGTKALKDEIIGKMINLVDFDSYYTVILVAQTIKDVGGNGSTIPINKKLTGDPTPTLVNAQLGKFDLTVNGSNYYYADDITSTVKVQAIIHKKTDGTCEVLSVKYIQ